jgi:hypothetical protein
VPFLLLGPPFFSNYSSQILSHMAASLKENNWFFVTDQTPRPYPTRSLPAQLISVCDKKIKAPKYKK